MKQLLHLYLHLIRLLFSFQRIRKYLKSHGVKDGLWYDPDARHGQSLLVGGSGIGKVLGWIKRESHKKT